MEARSVWNPEPAKNPPWRWSAGNPQGLVVHWVGGGAMRLDQQPHDACHAAVRSIQRYEMHSAPDNYSDIAYNTLACPHGILIEGRGLGVQGAANGGGTNGTYASVCVLGGQGDIFTSGHKQAIEEAWKYAPGRLLAQLPAVVDRLLALATADVKLHHHRVRVSVPHVSTWKVLLDVVFRLLDHLSSSHCNSRCDGDARKHALRSTSKSIY